MNRRAFFLSLLATPSLLFAAKTRMPLVVNDTVYGFNPIPSIWHNDDVSRSVVLSGDDPGDDQPYPPDSYPQIMADVANKVLRESYKKYPNTFGRHIKSRLA